MSEDLRFVPPSLDFDPRLANELARWETTLPAADGQVVLEPAGRRDPFNGYLRMLTPQGGILILYRDQYRSLPLTTLRVAAWIMMTWIGARLIFESSLSFLQFLLAMALLMVAGGLIVCWKIKVSHSVEIRPDAMIVDGEDVFRAQDIGDNWPQLQMKDDDPNRMVICGICGTRFIEYMTANRLDKNDRTPELLAADLQAAIEQLWGRREVTFTPAF
jgi:hypothetical protein